MYGYRVIWVCDAKGTRGVHCPGPFTHKEACTVLSKIAPHKSRRDLLEELTPEVEERDNMSKGYNGHKSWTHWNVSLWISNDEALYTTARELVRASKTLDDAAERILECLPEKTPDGARYSKSAVRAAISRDM